MRATAQRLVATLAREQLSGCVLNKDSPTCGLERVTVYGAGGAGARTGRGLFATALAQAFPDLPIEEEGRLADARLRDSFVVRVFVYHELERLFAARWTLGALVAFHAAHKMLLLAHAPAAYARLGRLVAGGRSRGRAELVRRYRHELMAALARPSTRGLHANVLQHMSGHLRGRLSHADRDELLGLIEEHRRGVSPLAAPLTLLRHHARRLGVGYLLAQRYLDAYPKGLRLEAVPAR